MTPWKLFLDDIRNPTDKYQGLMSQHWVIARSSEEAKTLVVANGMPELLSLDHDLGGDDTSMIFLNWLAREYHNGEDPIPGYFIHSSNPVGSLNMIAFLDSWRNSFM